MYDSDQYALPHDCTLEAMRTQGLETVPRYSTGRRDECQSAQCDAGQNLMGFYQRFPW